MFIISEIYVSDGNKINLLIKNTSIKCFDVKNLLILLLECPYLRAMRLPTQYPYVPVLLLRSVGEFLG
jgi:hypothetical protein